MKNNSLKQFVICLGFSLIFVANLFILIPYDIYIANFGEFVVPFRVILQLFAIPALMIVATSSVIALMLKEKFLQRFINLLAILSILIWAQSDIFLWEYGLLNGELINWSSGVWRGWVDLAIWITAISISVLGYKKFHNKVLQFAVIIFFIQIIMASYSVVINWEKLSDDQRYKNNALQQLYKFSSTHNIVHILLDGFQSDIFEDLVRHAQVGDTIKDKMEGFVFYNEALGIFPYTRFALPALLGGEIYQNKVSKNEFINSIFSGNTILNVAYNEGYEIDIASDEYWSKRYSIGEVNNSYILSDTDSSFDLDIVNAGRLIDLTLFKSVPHFVKRYIYNKQSWFIQSMITDLPPFNYFSHTKFMEQVTKNMIVDRNTPVYKFIHVMNVHNPMVVTQDCQFAGSAIATTRLTLTAQSLCTLSTVFGILEKMKSLGIYDDSLIILHADHGGWVKTRGYREQVLNNDLKLHSHIVSLGTPLIAIKQPNATGKLRVSDSLVSLADLPDTISDIMDWDFKFGHKSMLDVKSGEPRIRRYYYYTWQRDAWEAEYTGPIQEFIIDGSHFNTDWRAGKVSYPP